MHRNSECRDSNLSIVKSIDNYRRKFALLSIVSIVLYKKYPMANCRQSEILFLDFKMKNTPIIQVSSIIKMKDIASKNSPSNSPPPCFNIHAIDPLEGTEHWRNGRVSSDGGPEPWGPRAKLP